MRSFADIFKIPELRKRVFITLGILAIYRVGVAIPIPGINATALKALADPARLRLLSLIQAQPGSEACVCNLTQPLELSQGTVSHHLRVLREAGLVERDQRGSWAYYRVVPDALTALRFLLA